VWKDSLIDSPITALFDNSLRLVAVFTHRV
jgi:hypothetical protein